MSADSPPNLPAVHAAAGSQPTAPGAALAAAAVDRKALATLQARAALAGWALASFTEPDGRTSYTLSKWGRPMTLPDLSAVALHLRRVGAPE